MKRVLQLALVDLRLTLRERASFVWMLLMPVMLMWVFGNLGGGGNTTTRLTVVDADGSWLARRFVEELGADEQMRIVELTPEQAASTEDKVRTLWVPRGFTEQVLAGHAQTLRLEKDADSSAEFSLAAEVRTTRIVARTLGRLIELDAAGQLAASDASAVSEAAEARFVELGQRPPLVDLAVSTAGHGRRVPSGRAQSVPGMLTMSVTMMTIIYGAVFLTTEKKSGMLRRQLTLPVTRAHVFAGKLAGRFVLALLQCALLLAAGRLLYGLSYGASIPGLVVLVACYCLAVAGLSTLVGAALRTPEQAGSVGWLLGMALAALGGCWWPSEIMPRWMQHAGHVLPTAWAMDGFHALISFGRGLEGVALPSLVLLLFACAFSAVGARLLRVTGGEV